MFFGKNNLLSAALGKNEESEIANDLHKVAESLKGECLLLFTNNSSEEIKKSFFV
jgi:ribosomal protein L10